MGEATDGRLQELVALTDCPRDFGCIVSPDVCKARDIGYPDFIECLDEFRNMCAKKSSCGYGAGNDQFTLCRCQVRVHLAKNERDSIV